jgi:hypothetical protein
MRAVIAKRATIIAVMLVPLIGGCAAEKPRTPKTSSPATSAVLGVPEPLPGSTPPGTRLRFGDKAVITVGRVDDPSRVGVIVTGVDKALPEDMTALRASFPQRVTGWAYFIRVVLINEDGTNFSGYSGPLLYGNLEGGGDAGQIQLLGADLVLPHCTVHSSPPAGWSDARGARFETCRIVQSNPDSVRYDPGYGDDDIYWE